MMAGVKRRRGGMIEMRKGFGAFTVIGFALIALSLGWSARVGEPAPDFTGTDTNGKVHKLSEYQGKFVVLEWSNRGCPYTQKHYNGGNMQRLEREWTGRGVIWLTVISSAPGKQGYVTASEENAIFNRSRLRPLPSCWIRRELSVTCTMPKRRRTYSLSVRRELSFTTGRLMIGRPPIRPM